MGSISIALAVGNTGSIITLTTDDPTEIDTMLDGIEARLDRIGLLSQAGASFTLNVPAPSQPQVAPAKPELPPAPTGVPAPAAAVYAGGREQPDLNGAPHPVCAHGYRKWVSGFKGGRQYGFWACEADRTDPSKCPGLADEDRIALLAA